MQIDIKKGNKGVQVLENYKGLVLYGVPQVSNPRPFNKEGKVQLNNAQILSLMESGSKVTNLPKRELLEPVMIKHSSQIKTYFGRIFENLLKGNEKEADNLMEELALRMQTWCQSFFRENNGWAPNAPITVNGGWMRSKVTGKPFYVEGKKSNTPLIDTGELRKSIRGLFTKER